MATQSLLKRSTAIRALAFAGILTAPSTSIAGPVYLSSADGTFDVSGEWVGFENNMYIINTAFGEVRVDSDKVNCEGADCPTFASEAAVEEEKVETVTPQPAGAAVEDAPAEPVVEAAAPAVPQIETLRFAGSSTLGEGLMPLLIEGWSASLDGAIERTEDGSVVTSEIIGDQGFGDPLSAISVRATSSGAAFRSLLSGNSEFGLTSRPVTTAETRQFRNRGLGDMTSPGQEHIIAVDSLVAIVHPDNPVQNLQVDQLRGIFSGAITNWSQVGGPDAAINIYDRAIGNDARDTFMDTLFSRDVQPLQSATIVNSNSEMSDSVAEDPFAIGFVGFAFKRGARSMPLENECGMTVLPDSFSARTEEYEFQRRLYVYNTNADITGTSQDFLDYIRSQDADEVIEKAGFISLGVARRVQDFQSPRAQALLAPASNEFEGNRMREMLSQMVDFDRLSSTFRFTTGSSQLDRRAAIDMARLTDYLAEQPAGTEVKFVGFTDSVGTFENNQDLSERRAAQVMEALQSYAGDRLDGITFSSEGFGEVAPTACNTNEANRRINRRVEVWITASDA